MKHSLTDREHIINYTKETSNVMFQLIISPQTYLGLVLILLLPKTMVC